MTAQDVTFRAAAPNDTSRVLAFARQTFEETFGAANDPEDMRQYLAAAFTQAQQTADISANDCRVIIAEKQGVLVAYATVKDRACPLPIDAPHAVQLERFYVDPAHQGSGLAQRLMRQVLTRAGDMGATHLWLGVWEHNARGIRFYENQHFDDIGSVPFTLGTAAQTDRVMARKLNR
ncbi:MAG: GNAT family N-acetyltransferase [Pseudomonadota bacterium]